jgi:uncharacterized membrane protein
MSDESIDTIASLHAQAQENVDSHQRLMEHVTHRVGRPHTIYALFGVVSLWVVMNVVAHGRAPDPPPFLWMQGAITVYAALVTTIVLTTQNRLQRSAEQRAYLDLQVNLIAEQKTAKLIALIEELRRDLPSVRNRADPEAESMARAVNPEQVLTALEETLRTSSNPPGTPRR